MIKTSHIGSLPFKSLRDADQFNKSFDLPVLYSLPLLDKSQFMLAQVIGDFNTDSFDKGILGRNIKIPNLDSVTEYEEFKFQLVGPITLIKSFKKISPLEINLLLKWYLNQIIELFEKKRVASCYFFLDEPMLYMANDSDYVLLNNFLKTLKTKFFKVGIHCCSSFEISKINLSLIDGFSFESKYLNNQDFQNIDLFIGVLSTDTFELDPIIDLTTFSNQIYVTPHCGFALSDPQKLSSVSKKLTNWIKMTSL